MSRARELRRNATDAERVLWKHLRNRGLAGLKFRRQVAVDRYIVDFLCESAKLIVEVDGGQHERDSEKDALRDDVLARSGYIVLRFWNSDVLTNIDGVLTTIIENASAEFTREVS